MYFSNARVGLFDYCRTASLSAAKCSRFSDVDGEETGCVSGYQVNENRKSSRLSFWYLIGVSASTKQQTFIRCVVLPPDLSSTGVGKWAVENPLTRTIGGEDNQEDRT